MRSIFFIAVFASALVSACGDSSGPSGPGPAANLTILSGASIEGVAGETVATPLSIRVTDSEDRPVPGTRVQFSIPQGGGTLSAAADTTDSEGIAAVSWTLGQAVGSARAEAQVQGLAPAQFNAVVRAGPAAGLARVSPAPGTSAANFELADSVAIRVADTFGNPIANATVTFAVGNGGGSISHTSRISDGQGIARVAWQLGPVGPQALLAASGTLQTTVNAVATACPETSIAPGSVLTIGPADPRCVILAAPAARYFITVVNTAPSFSTTNSFRLRGAGASTPSTIANAVQPVAAPKLGLRTAAARAQVEEARRAISAHDALMRANEDVLRRLGPGRAGALAALRRSNTMAAMAPPPSVGDTLNLRIPTNFSNLCSLDGASAVRGRVVFVGLHGVMLEDINSPLAGQIDTLYTRVGQEFDTGMWQLLLDNFGNPLAMDDQTDDNDRFFMLFSPVVNNLQGGGIAGFVSSSDFFPPTGTQPCPASNLAEIFYARVPTVIPQSPGDTYDQGTPGDWYRRVRTVMMHEVKHIVSFAERLSRNQVPNATFNAADRWLEESSAMLAEELWGRTIFGYQGEANVTYQQSIYCEVRLNAGTWPECPQPYKPLNIFDHFILLYEYLSGIEGLSPLGGASPNDFSFYGSGWSFLRWVIDHHAVTEGGFTQALTQEFVRPGVQNIEQQTGRLFADLVNEWSVALIMDDYPNFIPTNARHTLPSWSSRDVFANMSADFPSNFTRAHPLQPRAVAFGSFAVDVSSVRGGGISVFEVSGTQDAQQLFEVSGLNGTNFPSDMRVNIIRVE